MRLVVLVTLFRSQNNIIFVLEFSCNKVCLLPNMCIPVLCCCNIWYFLIFIRNILCVTRYSRVCPLSNQTNYRLSSLSPVISLSSYYGLGLVNLCVHVFESAQWQVSLIIHAPSLLQVTPQRSCVPGGWHWVPSTHSLEITTLRVPCPKWVSVTTLPCQYGCQMCN